jgi:hypothetical protein
MRTASWVIVDKQTGRAVLETFSARVVAAINTASYRAVPIGQWLASLNRRA